MKAQPAAAQDLPGKRARWQSEPLVWMLIVIPLVAVLGGFFTFYLAIESNDGLVADDYYQRGKEINRVLARDQIAAALELNSRIWLDYAHSRVTAELTADASYQLPTEIRLQFSHATRSGFDRTLQLAQVAAGKYLAELPVLPAGHWYLQLEADDWRLTGSLLVPESTASAKPNAQSQVIELPAGQQP